MKGVGRRFHLLGSAGNRAAAGVIMFIAKSVVTDMSDISLNVLVDGRVVVATILSGSA